MDAKDQELGQGFSSSPFDEGTEMGTQIGNLKNIEEYNRNARAQDGVFRLDYYNLGAPYLTSLFWELPKLTLGQH